MKQIPTHAFTERFERIVPKLVTECVVSLPGGLKIDFAPKIECRAIWDTGATHTTISRTLANNLKLKAVDSIKTRTIAGIIETEYVMADLLLPGMIGFRSWKVAAGELRENEVLIGMDIISMGDFAVTNTDGKTTLSFRIPSDKVIDFTQTEESQRKKSWLDFLRKGLCHNSL